LRARAFTRDGQVSLPAERGSLSDPGTAGLLAHELTHVAQQRAYGPSLPLEHTPLGRLLEHQARQVEREVRGDPTPAEPATAAAPTDSVADLEAALDRLRQAGAIVAADGTVYLSRDHAATIPAGIQRADEDEEDLGLAQLFAEPAPPGG